ncbi:hypothetical protein D0T84_04555 [Dysgonomonas sp. 521]|uniref:hypothetical protein n=1 Tax=Dysgonomonas sp. 521 TaxID=2302932 RepID=UPI0013D88ECC|nr:hypothetical protein [Dysgonomonas sp. 521]NDV94189.1 hypothetical protein [Dysgonomonas sp. 521]
MNKSILNIIFIFALFSINYNMVNAQPLELAWQEAESKDYIDKKLANKLKPVLKSWLDFYNLDIHKFRLGQQGETSSTLEDLAISVDTASIYHRPFNKESDDIYEPVLYDYSPNKRFYLNVRETALVYRDEDNKWRYEGGDDCMEVYLTDRKKENSAIILWLGSSAFAEAAFWLNNDTFIIVGYTDYEEAKRFLYLRGKINANYYTDMNEIPPGSEYFIHDLKSRGVICN